MRPTTKRRVPPTIILALTLAGCSPKLEVKHYSIEAKVIAVDAQRKQLIIEHGDIPGFMSAMTMSYTVARPSEVASLHPGDKITADLVVTENTTARLEKIRLLAKATPTPTPAPAPAPNPESARNLHPTPLSFPLLSARKRL